MMKSLSPISWATRAVGLLVLLCVLSMLGSCASRLKPGLYTFDGHSTLYNSIEAEQLLRSHLQEFKFDPPLDRPLRLLAGELPEYQFGLRRRGISGQVTLKFQIDTDGSVSDIEVVHSDHRSLTHISRRAVSKWRFEPPTRNGQATSLTLVHPFNFKLED